MSDRDIPQPLAVGDRVRSPWHSGGVHDHGVVVKAYHRGGRPRVDVRWDDGSETLALHAESVPAE